MVSEQTGCTRSSTVVRRRKESQNGQRRVKVEFGKLMPGACVGRDVHTSLLALLHLLRGFGSLASIDAIDKEG